MQGSLKETVLRRFSALVSAMRYTNDVTACEGLVQFGKPGVSKALNAVREPCAGESSHARFFGGRVSERERHCVSALLGW